MATGAKMSYNHFQSGKFGVFPQNSQKDTEVTHDMHLKMSKKIAQLTKVIYALNTKNDENEQVVQTLHDQHELEIQQILADTSQKVALYKDKLDEESDHRATIEALQTDIVEQRTQYGSLDKQFISYMESMREKQDREREDYATKLFDMSHEVLTAKKDFEAYMDSFNSWRERITADHNKAMTNQASKHQAELEDLRSFQRNQDDTWLNQCTKIEDKFKDQIENLKAQLEAVENEKLKVSEEYSIKLEKTKAFYDKELEALQKNRTEKQTNEVEIIRKEIVKLKNGFGLSERELRHQIERLVQQLVETEDALEASKCQHQLLQVDLSNTDSSSSELVKQLQNLKDVYATQSTSLLNTETELSGSKQHCSHLADELMKKSTLLGELEAHNMQKGDVMKSLHLDLENMKSKLTRVEAERSSLMSQQYSMSSEITSQLQSLRQSLEDMTIEKETQKQRLEKQIKNLQEQMAQQEKELKDKMTQKLSELEKSHADNRDRERKIAAEVLVSTKQELIKSHEVELSQAQAVFNSLEQEMEKMKSDLTAKLNNAEQEIKRLDTLVSESEEGLGSASGLLSSLRDAANLLRAELDKARVELKAAKSTAAHLQSELDKTKVMHGGKLAEFQVLAKNRSQQALEDLEVKWKQTMKIESSKLRAELSAQKEEEKKAALGQLAKLKDEQVHAVKAGLDQQMDHLRKQIKMLESALNDTKQAEEAHNADWADRLERERSRLNKDMLEAANEYSVKISAMERIQAEELKRLTAQKDHEKEECERTLRQKHLEELQAQISAHKAAMDNASQLEQRQRKDTLNALKAQNDLEMEKLCQQLEDQKQTELESVKHSHANEIRAARMELDRAVEISRQKDKDHELQEEELRTEISHREQHIKNLQDQMKKLQEEIDKLAKQIEVKVMEIKQVQKHAGQQIKVQEDNLAKKYQNSMDNANADHLKEQQDMLTQFSSAQEMLRDKISQLQIELQEAQLRYDQRKSRPEDLELIDSLRCEVSERATRIKDLIDEKRFYQLELVNRETNFNKVFNTTPNVGVLNPFAKSKKKGHNLSMVNGGGNQRLDPLPGSPLHDGKLNPSKPLPQPHFTKKFVK